MPRSKRKSSGYDPKELIKAWNTAETPQEVAERFHMTKDQVIQIASVYRRKKLFMKNMRKGPNVKVDWRELQDFSRKFEKQHATG